MLEVRKARRLAGRERIGQLYAEPAMAGGLVSFAQMYAVARRRRVEKKERGNGKTAEDFGFVDGSKDLFIRRIVATEDAEGHDTEDILFDGIQRGIRLQETASRLSKEGQTLLCPALMNDQNSLSHKAVTA